MENSFHEYQQVLLKLAHQLGLTYANDEWQALIDQKIQGTNIDRSMDVARWVIDFFNCFIQKREVDDVSFDGPGRGRSEDDRWIALASMLLPGDWVDEGEYRSVDFESLKFEGYIMYEGDFYIINQY